MKRATPDNDDAVRAVIDEMIAESIPMLRAALRRALAAHLDYLRAPSPRRERIPAEHDDAAVDDLARARARALLDRVKGGRRG